MSDSKRPISSDVGDRDTVQREARGQSITPFLRVDAPGESLLPRSLAESASVEPRTFVDRSGSRDIHRAADRLRLVGRGAMQIRARIELLRSIARKVTEAERSRVLCAAAELHRALGEDDLAYELFGEALSEDPTCLLAIRALRARGEALGHVDEVDEWLARELNADITPKERVAILLYRATIHAHRKGSPASALQLARDAVAVDPTNASAIRLVAELAGAFGDNAESADALLATARIWRDENAGHALLVRATQYAQHTPEQVRAIAFVETALQAAPHSLGVLIAAMRAFFSFGDLGRAADAAKKIGAELGNGTNAEAFRWLSVRLRQRDGALQKSALDELANARTVPGLRAVFEVAVQHDEIFIARVAAESLAAMTTGAVRAGALASAAECIFSTGNTDGAVAMLREAARADEANGEVAVVRALLELQGVKGDWRGPTSAEDANRAAWERLGRLAIARGAEMEEQRRLLFLMVESDEPALCDVLLIAVSRDLDDVTVIEETLRRVAGRVKGTRRASFLFALWSLTKSSLSPTDARALLVEATTADATNTTIARALARLIAGSDARAAAAPWISESRRTTGLRADFSLAVAARNLEPIEAVAHEHWSGALSRMQANGILSRRATVFASRTKDAALLESVHRRLGEFATDPIEKAKHWLRASRAATQSADIETLVEQVHALLPDDILVGEYLWRAGLGLLTKQANDSQAAGLTTWHRFTQERVAYAHEVRGEWVIALDIWQKLKERDAAVERAETRLRWLLDDLAPIVDALQSVASDVALDVSARIDALEELADIDLYARHDEAAAAERHAAILELDPSRVSSLRATERWLFEHTDPTREYAIEHSFVACLAEGRDVSAHLRLALGLGLRKAAISLEELDELVVAGSLRTTMDLWLARRVEVAAQTRGWTDAAVDAAREVSNHLFTPEEASAAALRAAELSLDLGDVHRAVEILSSGLRRSPRHVLAASHLAALAEQAGDTSESAHAYEALARATNLPARALDAWYAAACLYQDALVDVPHARTCLEECARLDLMHGDVFDRLSRALRDSRDGIALSKLLAARIGKGGAPKQIAAWSTELAQLHAKIGDRHGMKDALRASIEADPKNIEALQLLVEIAVDEEDWNDAVAMLAHWALAIDNLSDLFDVLMRLGDLYERKIEDLERAEETFTRATELFPAEDAPLERLAGVHIARGQFEQAIACCVKLCELSDNNPDLLRARRLFLAQTYEQSGAVRQAEVVLEQVRKAAPYDVEVLRVIAELHLRHNDKDALDLHLRRAASDLRGYVQETPSAVDGWCALMDVLDWRGRADAARVVASTAIAIGHSDPALSERVNLLGAVPGGGPLAATSELDALIGADLLPVEVRDLVRVVGDVLDKAVHFDPRMPGATQVSFAESPWRVQATDVCRWFNLPEVELWVSTASPRICMPFRASPLAIVIGAELYETCSEQEKTFLLARAIKLARAQLISAVRSSPGEMALTFAALFRFVDPTFTLPNFPEAQLADSARRVGKYVARQNHDEVVRAVTLAMLKAHADPMRIPYAVSSFGDRVALVITGAAPAAVTAILRIAGEADAGHSIRARIDAVRRVAQAKSLVDFATSEVHFEARRRTGADRRS